MKKVAFALAVAGAAFIAGHAYAEENWTPYTDGISIGSAAGALPPPGWYFQNTLYYATEKGHDGSGHFTGSDIHGIVDVPVLMWAPNITILGAQYAVAVVQPLDRVDGFGGNGYNNDEGIGKSGIFETVISPINLSWSLPNDFHLATGLGIYIPDGSFHSSQAANAGMLPSSNFWSFEPSVGISWLHEGWNLSAKFLADLNLKDNETDYQSGHVADVDLTAEKTFGKWSAGIGGYVRYQFTDDVQYGVKVNGDGNRAQETGLGPVVGYNFGPVMIEAFYTKAVTWKNEAAGDRLFTRLTIPF